VDLLSSLPDRELIDTLYRIVRTRNEEQTFEPDEFQRGRWCIAITSFGRYQGRTDPAAEIELVGQVADRVKDGGWAILSEQGTCEFCKSQIISVSKLAICPVCSTEVYCT